jgi:hypothetical protein
VPAAAMAGRKWANPGFSKLKIKFTPGIIKVDMRSVIAMPIMESVTLLRSKKTEKKERV